MRALPPNPDFLTFSPVTPFVLDLTKPSMLSNFQFPKSKNIPQAHPLATHGNKFQIRGPPIPTGLEYHQYMEVMERATDNDNVGQREIEEK